MDRRGVLSNLRNFEQWDSMNYSMRKDEADVVIDALIEREPVYIHPLITFDEGVKVGACECGQNVLETDHYCRKCGKPLQWGKERA